MFCCHQHTLQSGLNRVGKEVKDYFKNDVLTKHLKAQLFSFTFLETDMRTVNPVCLISLVFPLMENQDKLNALKTNTNTMF